MNAQPLFTPARGLLLASVVALASALSSIARAAEVVYPGGEWVRAAAGEAGMDMRKLEEARDHALRGGGSGMVTRGGRLILSWGDLERRYDLKSTTKSFGTGALALAIGDGKVRLDDRARKHHPSLGVPPEENARTGWLEKITIGHLAAQTAGFDKPGGYEELLFEPGTKWSYSDGGPNWLAECLTLAYRRDLLELMNERVFRPIGIGEEDLTWRRNAYRSHEIEGVMRREFGAGIHANADAMARYGYLWLRGGRWRDLQILPRELVERAPRTDPAVRGLPVVRPETYHDATDHYGLLWWNNDDGELERVPRDAYWSWGLYDSLIVVIPSLDIVASRAGKGWRERGGSHYEVLRPFFEAIVGSVLREPSWARARAPYPRSTAVRGLRWAAASSVRRAAKGSDNWPLAWGDDDALYCAYGDGRGFEPHVPEKLSLGLARIVGPPDAFEGANLRAPSIEAKGDGRAGKKASGLIMVDGVLYMWLRNAENSELAWSEDRGRTWQRCDWKLTTSFGAPTFVEFGRDYAGARDEFVYSVSHDAESAYAPADRMVMCRAPKDRLRDRRAYEFFAGSEPRGGARWSRDIGERAAVFEHPGRCYRSGLSYNAALGRYFWCQTIPGGDTRFDGGLGIYDAPEPWGPWTTVYYEERWDMGPGETSRFPPKWMSDDGRVMHLVFSGDDAFSVRKATLELSEEER